MLLEARAVLLKLPHRNSITITHGQVATVTRNRDSERLWRVHRDFLEQVPVLPIPDSHGLPKIAVLDEISTIGRIVQPADLRRRRGLGHHDTTRCGIKDLHGLGRWR